MYRPIYILVDRPLLRDSTLTCPRPLRPCCPDYVTFSDRITQDVKCLGAYTITITTFSIAAALLASGGL
jgi:hypothetical protein